MHYLHAWSETLGPIARKNSIVIDPAAWGYETAPDRDAVDSGTEHSPRWWNVCADVDHSQPRLVTSFDHQHTLYVDFKLFKSSLTCSQQWAALKQWLTYDHERVLHIVNDQQGCGYAWFALRLQQLQIPDSVHVDLTVRLDSLDDEIAWRDRAVSCIQGTPRSLVVNCVWHKMCYVHVYNSPHYAAGDRILRTY